jgi:hypothetical protein
MLSTKKVFPRHRNRQHAKRAKPPLGTTGVPAFFIITNVYLAVNEWQTITFNSGKITINNQIY